MNEGIVRAILALHAKKIKINLRNRMIAYIFATEQLRIKVRQIEMTDIPANFEMR